MSQPYPSSKKHLWRPLGSNAGEWEDWAALRYNGAAIRDCAPLFAEHGVNQVSPFVDNEVVAAVLDEVAERRLLTRNLRTVNALMDPTVLEPVIAGVSAGSKGGHGVAGRAPVHGWVGLPHGQA
ncbi:hypothetical protein [Streptomyces sp. NPDC086519]|uniref:hypothetical protein n=1 Tax=Streptomyces sp. NPDC086519 TaxID=3154863 RepID=UPI003445DD70